jgi:hypothetical protein
VGRTLMDAAIIIYCSKLIRSATSSKATAVVSIEPPSSPHTGTDVVQSVQLMVAAMGEREGPVLIGVRHAHHSSRGGIVMRFDLASTHLLRAGDSLFIIARDLAVLGKDIVALGRKMIGGQQGLMRLVQALSPPDGTEGAAMETPDESGAGMAQSLSALPLATLVATAERAQTPRPPRRIRTPSTSTAQHSAADSSPTSFPQGVRATTTGSRAPLPPISARRVELGGPGPPPPELSGHIVVITNDLTSLHHLILPLLVWRWSTAWTTFAPVSVTRTRPTGCAALRRSASTLCTAPACMAQCSSGRGWFEPSGASCWQAPRGR